MTNKDGGNGAGVAQDVRQNANSRTPGLLRMRSNETQDQRPRELEVTFARSQN
jgi:hypothetical protein